MSLWPTPVQVLEPEPAVGTMTATPTSAEVDATLSKELAGRAALSTSKQSPDF